MARGRGGSEKGHSVNLEALIFLSSRTLRWRWSSSPSSSARWDRGCGRWRGVLLVQRKVELQALVLTFNDGFLDITLAVALGAGLVLLLKRSQPGMKIEGIH